MVPILVFAIFIIFPTSHGLDVPISDLCGDNSWSVYKDEKCIKLINQFVTRDEAQNICQNLAGSGSIITIKSEDEQRAIEKILYGDLQVVDNVWFGAVREKDGAGSSFIWENGDILEYSNWAAGNPSDDLSKNCSQLPSGFFRSNTSVQDDSVIENGQWFTAVCSRRNLVLCQKLQNWSINQIQQLVLEQREELKKKSKELSTLQEKYENLEERHESLQENYSTLKKNPVPIGFVFTQLPGQPEPAAIWPEVKWTEISSEFAGLFFRVAGNGSAAFGTVQEANQHRITQASFGANMKCDGLLYDLPATISIPQTGSSQNMRAGYYRYSAGEWNCEYLNFQTTGGELRPRNTALRIWKRTA